MKPLILTLTAGAVSIAMAGHSHADTWLEDPTTGFFRLDCSVIFSPSVLTWFNVG
jgi:hypothetical protein